MKSSKIIKISLHRIKQNRKRNLIVILPVSTMLIIMLIVNMIEYSMEQYIDNIKNNLDLRTIGGLMYKPDMYEETVEKIIQIANVEMVIGQDEERVVAKEICNKFKKGKADGTVYLKPVNEKVCPEVIVGRKIEDGDSLRMVIPSKIYAGDWRKYDDQILENEYIDGKQFIGEKITINFSASNGRNADKEFEVVGIYNSEKYNENQDLYVPIHIIKQLNKELRL